MTEISSYLGVKEEEKNSGQDDSDSSSDVDDWDLPSIYNEPRHLEPIKGEERVEHSWRVKEKISMKGDEIKEKWKDFFSFCRLKCEDYSDKTLPVLYKTHCVALVLCLNVGVDPPDVVKTQPCARLECWIDPQSMSPSKALESIGHSLQTQYERWQPRARYKQSLDPTSEEVKKLCCSLRRNAKDERVLFHYNGHGVPKPTSQGEIWVFNRSYTQYIPLSVYDLQTWMGAPSLYVYDCSNAGVIVDNFRQFAEQHEREQEAAAAADGGAGAPVSYRNCIQLAACAAGQSLPMNPELPADLFTACLTTPVKMAMKWFVLRTRTRIAPPDVHELIDKIPGQVGDRRTMLGELNWIFTAITDTIAWSSLPPELFHRLFRADLLTASLCRNFLLAERIMRSYNCTPVSRPALPPLAAHPLWAAWEHTLDAALAQLPALARGAAYAHSPFFGDQLTAFEVWLELGSARRRGPAQLPMVLQVLLSTLHRVRALRLLCRYLALGAPAARNVLSVGIFPYMLKLLQASAPNLRDSMVFIWSRIVSVDPSCQADLVNAKGHKYFLAVLQDPAVDSEHRTLAAYVLAAIVDDYPAGREAALQGSMISICLEQLSEGSAPLAQWACIALARLWRGFEAARWAGVRDLAHEKLFPLLRDRRPELRAAAAHALGAFVAAGGARSEHADALAQQVAAALAAAAPQDASALVRQELLAALQWPVLIFEQTFVAVCLQERGRRSDRADGGGGRVDPGQDALAAPRGPPRRPTPPLPTVGFGSVYVKLWTVLNAMAREPHALVAKMARDIVQHVAEQVDAVRGPPSPDEADGARRRRAPGARRAIVSTQYAEWAGAQLARRRPAEPDAESRAQHERAWRRARDAGLRRRAAELRAARGPRLDAVAWNARCALPPAAVQFHPYEQHAAVASKDDFGVWEWGSGARLGGGGWRRAWGRLTALAYLDAERAGVLAAASHAGHVAAFRVGGGDAPLAAWRALEPRPPPAACRPPPAQPIYSLAQLVGEQEERAPPGPPPVLLAWCARRGLLALGGHAPRVRLWDVRAEMLAAELATEAEAPVTSLRRGGGALLVAGFGDGAVRAWDERAAPAEGPALALHAHGAAVLAATHRADARALVSVCAAGELRVLDVRARAVRAEARAPAPLAAADVHPAADLVACGSVAQVISVFDLRGVQLNAIKFHEGFMGARIGPVSCLAFHPLRPALAVGSRDSTVSVYAPDARR